jgi:hypothetical protein
MSPYTREGTGRFRIPADFNEMEPTPVEPMQEITQTSYQTKPPTTTPSKTFIAAIAAILGVLISSGTIIGVLGKAFYVQRDEYTQKTLRDAEAVTVIQQTLARMENAIGRQGASVDKLADAIQTIKLDMARRGK